MLTRIDAQERRYSIYFSNLNQISKAMNEGSPMIYHGNGGFGGPGPMYMVGMERQARHYPLDVVQVPGASPANGNGTPRRWQQRRDRYKDNTAFGYDSDDSSLSSNASGSNKSGDKGEGSSRGSSSGASAGGSIGGGGGGFNVGGGLGGGGTRDYREWRSRRGREATARPRRIAPERYLNASYPFQVKFTPDDLLNGSKWDTLSQEMWDKFVKSQQTEDTFRKKMNLWRYIYITIKSIFPRYGLYVVGSTMSGFGLESSDMDLCLYIRPLDNVDPRAHALLHLNYILGYIKTFDPEAELIQAKVPILKFRDARNGVQVDLNCNNVVGIRNTNLLYGFSRMDWRVRPLVAVTKLWAQAHNTPFNDHTLEAHLTQARRCPHTASRSCHTLPAVVSILHNINDARQRTLSSYSLTLMVIHFLQCEYTAQHQREATDAVLIQPHAHGHTLPAVHLAVLQCMVGVSAFPYGSAQHPARWAGGTAGWSGAHTKSHARRTSSCSSLRRRPVRTPLT
ncbi:hypothetical protein evm_012362 [Chilo suppressalis]|nr:hypothetical protein evm_012362 [Chilo suppressalis]